MLLNQGKAAVCGAKSTDASGVGSWSARDEYCPPGNTEGNCAAGQNPSPVGEWKLDENTGTNARDTSGNGYNGTLTGSPLWANGKCGTGLATSSNGTLQYVTVTDTDDLDFSNTVDFTISAWVKLSSIKANGRVDIVRKNYTGGPQASYALLLSDSGGSQEAWCDFIDSGGTNDTVNGGYLLFDNKWHYIACVMDRNGSEIGTPGYHIFIDGRWDNLDNPLSAGTTVNDQPFIVGESNTVDGEMINGGFDNIRVYRYAKTKAQIAWEYDQSKPFAWWRMDENTGSTANDASGNGFNGTKSGATYVTGKRNYALNFDGSNDYVDMNDPSYILSLYDLQDLSISGWFNRDTFTTDDTIVAKRNGVAAGDIGYILYIDDSTDKLTFEVSDGTDEYQIESASTFTSTGWNYFAIIYDDDSAAGMKIYINGVEENITRTGTLANIGNADNGVDFRIGGESDTD